jgi:hypothetical protein
MKTFRLRKYFTLTFGLMEISSQRLELSMQKPVDINRIHPVHFSRNIIFKSAINTIAIM